MSLNRKQRNAKNAPLGDANLAALKRARLEQPLSDEQKYLSILKEWEENAPTGENRTKVANQLKNCLAEGATKFKLNNSNITALPLLPPLVTFLEIRYCSNFTTAPDNLGQLTYLYIALCPNVTTLPNGLSRLNSLTINYCPSLTEFPNDLPANLAFYGDYFAHPIDYVGMKLHIKSAYWTNTAQEIVGFKEYFITKMWNTEEAQRSADAFKQKQLRLIEQMDKDPELRQACLDLAFVGSADCHDNAFAMFQQMQEKALDIAMHKPNVPVNQLIAYGLALENKTKLMQLIDDKPKLKQGINGGEGTEALLALQLLCHEKNIALPIPVTAMHYEPTGWEQFRTPTEGDVTVPMIKHGIGKLIEYVIPRNAKPSAAFLAAQPFWQAGISRLNPAISQEIAVIETTATEKLDIENEKLFGGGGASNPEIEQNMKAIEQERLHAIAYLYLAETVQMLS